jgi:hypothetical protein
MSGAAEEGGRILDTQDRSESAFSGDGPFHVSVLCIDWVAISHWKGVIVTVCSQHLE